MPDWLLCLSDYGVFGALLLLIFKGFRLDFFANGRVKHMSTLVNFVTLMETDQ